MSDGPRGKREIPDLVGSDEQELDLPTLISDATLAASTQSLALREDAAAREIARLRKLGADATAIASSTMVGAAAPTPTPANPPRPSRLGVGSTPPAAFAPAAVPLATVIDQTSLSAGILFERESSAAVVEVSRPLHNIAGPAPCPVPPPPLARLTGGGVSAAALTRPVVAHPQTVPSHREPYPRSWVIGGVALLLIGSAVVGWYLSSAIRVVTSWF